jgi:hypothetical protein
MFSQNKNSSGYDEITSKILKTYASVISFPLSFICSHSLHTGIFPDHLKIAVVKPLYKKVDEFSMTNYRPISLLPIFSKVFKTAMHSRLSHHLHTNNILVPEQHAFRKGMSTEDAAFRLTDSVFKFLNQKLHVGGIFCDLSKAFDCGNHEILLKKLHFYGIQGVTTDWFRFYLTNRRQKVEIKSPNSTQNFFSDWGILKCGAPKGSILGPLLFLVYINNLPLKINSFAEPVLFADDTSVIISNGNFRDFSTTSNLVLSSMIEWFAANKLVLNMEKTNITKYVTNNSPYCALTIGYKDKYREEAVNTEFLGMHLDNHLNWKDHIDQIIPKLSAACYVVRQMYHFVNHNTLKPIYFTYFHSTVKYGIIFWGNSSNSRKIFTLQKKIIRIMDEAHPRTSFGRLFKKLVILPVPSQYIYSLMNFFISNHEIFQTNSSTHIMNTRNKHHLHRPIANLSCFQKIAFYSGIRTFNSLPQSMTNLKNEKTQFKVALERYLNADSFYSVDEFLACTDVL